MFIFAHFNLKELEKYTKSTYIFIVVVNRGFSMSGHILRDLLLELFENDEMECSTVSVSCMIGG